MASSMVLKLACLLLVSMIASAPLALARPDITCSQMLNSLMPCINYVLSGGAVPVNCCNGIKSVYQAANNTADRQSVCKCLKSAVSGVPYAGFNLDLAAGLPAKCGVNIPYKISPSTDCNSVN